MLYIFENENHINSVSLKTVVNKNASPSLGGFLRFMKEENNNNNKSIMLIHFKGMNTYS